MPSRTYRWRDSFTVGVLVGGMCIGSAKAHAQSLAEIAAREAARRAAITTPSRVYTNRGYDGHTRAEPTLPDAKVVAAIAIPSERTAAHAAAVAVPNASTADAGVPASPTRAADNSSAAAAPAQTSSTTGWSTFQIKKTAAELAESARLTDASDPSSRTGPSDVELPPQHDAMRLSTGLSYLQSTDWGGEISGSGKINGLQADIGAFFTVGAMGFQPRNGRGSIFTPGGKWRGEGGDLYSDVRGLARGARVSWNAGQRWTPSVSLYLRRAGLNSETVLAYRDRLQVLPRLRIGGELATDGARFVQVQYAQPNVDLTAFHRFVPGVHGGRDNGIAGGVVLRGGVALAGAVRVSDATNDRGRWQLASIRLPLARQASITLERSWWNASAHDGAINAVGLQLPLGPVRFVQRFQWGRTDYVHRAVPFGFNQRQIQSTASYTPGPWGSVNYQQSTEWFEDGRAQQWDEVASLLQLGPRTTALFVTAFPNVSDPRRFRARVTHQLSPTLSLDVQYGRLSAFQRFRASDDEQSRVMLTLRKIWHLQSPARGGDVRGRAIDQAGYPVSGALVRLGPYSTITDDAGEYEFTRVPDGQFELAIDKDKLPAAYASDETPQALSVTRGTRKNIDLLVVPLNTIRGRVYVDADKNGWFDDGEGVPNVVIALNGVVTATTANGSYAFYNQAPGHYKIRLDVLRLPKGLAPISPAELDVELTADHPLFGVDFRLEKKDMPIIMQGTRP
jgi:hypothetical protein